LEQTVPRAEIREAKVLPTSLMPEGLESVLSVQDCADLLSLIRGGK
jgi:hypothetical protein